jgi:hypothetical protein
VDTSTWREFVPLTKNFTVKLPPDQVFEKVDRLPGSLDKNSGQYELTLPDMKYEITVVDIAKDENGEIEQIKRGLLTPGVTLVSDNKATLASREGREWVMSHSVPWDTITLKVRVFVLDQRLYALSANPLSPPNEQAAQFFFESFRLLK